MAMTEYAGQQRFVAGRLRYPTPPEPGAIVGPNTTSEYMVVLRQDGADTLVGFATTEDRVSAMRRAVIESDPRSLTEYRMVDWSSEYFPR
ncbi:hypothetical protein ACIBTV_27120 [Micromonospora sp. NPDC049366]|uniref:hypothetical protein n=1 Tax=Micromonospora sp. NPDC049366 TaxID=3364271 RepID=UPI003793A07B